MKGYGSGRNQFPAQIELRPNALQGLQAGEFLSFGGPNLSGDQNEANRNSFCLDFEQTEDLILTGFSSIFIEIQSNFSGKFAIVCRICDENPETGGESTLISFGVKNFGDLKANEKNFVRIQTKATTFTIPKKHRLLVCFSPSFFPILFPLKKNQGILTIFPNSVKILIESTKGNEIPDRNHEKKSQANGSNCLPLGKISGQKPGNNHSLI